MVLAKTAVDLNASFEKHWESQQGGRRTGRTSSLGSTTTITWCGTGMSWWWRSRALLCREGKPKRMTKDHCPSKEEEKKHIVRAGGFVECNNIGRHLVNGDLAMSRYIGT